MPAGQPNPNSDPEGSRRTVSIPSRGATWVCGAGVAGSQPTPYGVSVSDEQRPYGKDDNPALKRVRTRHFRKAK